MNAPSYTRQRHARGLVLPTVLIMLLVLTIASLVIVEQIGSQTRMAGNAAVEQVALQAAESGLREVVNDLNSRAITADSSGYYTYQASSTPPWQVAANWSSLTNNPAITCASPATMAVSQCKYMIESLPAVMIPGNDSKHSTPIFRITVRAVGTNNQSVVMLQSLYQLP